MDPDGPVVVIGDVMTDVIAPAHDSMRPSDPPPSLTTRQGGAGANVAHWLARLGVPTAFVGCVGDDPFGVEAAAVLQVAGVELHIRTDPQFKPASREALQQGYVAIDTETDSLDNISAKLAGISLATAPNRACYIPIGHAGGEIDGVLPAAQQGVWSITAATLPFQTSLDVSYVGSHSYNILGSNPDVNSPDLGSAYLAQNQDPTLSSNTPGGAAVTTGDVISASTLTEPADWPISVTLPPARISLASSLPVR